MVFCHSNKNENIMETWRKTIKNNDKLKTEMIAHQWCTLVASNGLALFTIFKRFIIFPSLLLLLLFLTRVDDECVLAHNFETRNFKPKDDVNIVNGIIKILKYNSNNYIEMVGSVLFYF